jgi:hypothetical protein
MTHDELLKFVKFRLECAESKYLQEEAPAVNALLAVVELHKPVLHSKHKYICEGCNLVYPCDTIQAIEKELQ